MSDKIYHEITDFDFENIKSLLESNDVSKVIEGLISTAFYSANYNLSLNLSVQYARHSNENIRGCAMECFGHIARLHKSLVSKLLNQ